MSKWKLFYKQAIDEGTIMSGLQILDKVLKSKSGYAHGLGHGVKLISSKDLEFETILQAEKVGAKKQTDELIEQIKNKKEQIKSQQATINDLQELQNQLKALFEEFMLQQRV